MYIINYGWFISIEEMANHLKKKKKTFSSLFFFLFHCVMSTQQELQYIHLYDIYS